MLAYNFVIFILSYVIGGLRRKFKSQQTSFPCSTPISLSSASRFQFNVVPNDSKQLSFSYKPMEHSFNMNISEDEVLRSHNIGVRDTNIDLSTPQHNKSKVSEGHSTKQFRTYMYSDVKKYLRNNDNGFCEQRSILSSVPNNFEGLISSSSSVLHRITSTYNVASNSTQVVSPVSIDSTNALHSVYHKSLKSVNDKADSISQHVKRVRDTQPVSDSLSDEVISTKEQNLTANAPDTSKCGVISYGAPGKLKVNCTHNQNHVKESNSSKIFCQWEDCKGYVIA